MPVETSQTVPDRNLRPARLAIVGLGNPGPRYAGTRHNIGFEVADRLVGSFSVREPLFVRNHFLARASYSDTELFICKPATYMNRSGEAVSLLCEMHELQEHELLVVYDEVQLPLGQLRLRRNGSSGGHNGLASIIEACGSTEIPRLRCGVDFSSDGGDLADYVLSSFTPEEQDLANDMIHRAVEAVRYLVEFGFDKAMNMFNTSLTNNQDSL